MFDPHMSWRLGFLVYRIFSHCIWCEEHVRMTVGECNSTCQRNICHKGITALWSDSLWEESSLLSMEGFAWVFPSNMLTLRVHMQHNLIHPLILGIILAAKQRFVILIRISIQFPLRTQRRWAVVNSGDYLELKTLLQNFQSFAKKCAAAQM